MVRSSGLLLATVGVVGTLWCVGLHFVAVLPHFVGHRPLESLAGLCHLAFSVFLAHGGFYNYFKCMYTPPGSPSLSEAKEKQLESLLFNRRSAGLKDIKHNAWCRKCEKPKPKRAHHCSICKKCILGMDHHCPWVWTCVGQNNQKYFFLFLLYAWMGSFYGLVMMSYPFMELFIHKPWEINASREAIFFSWIVILFGNCGVAAMVIFQGYIISKGKTTLEFYQSRRVAKKGAVAEQEYFNEYDHGLRKNWEIFFERKGWSPLWLFSWLPPSPANYIPPPAPDYGVPTSLLEGV